MVRVPVLLAAGLVWLRTLLPQPWGAVDRAVLSALGRPAPAALLLLMAVWAAWLGLRARSQGSLEVMVDREEPLLRSPQIMSCRSSKPVVVLVGLDAGAGVSTLAFNLAVTLAVDGRAREGGSSRACRPVCLLRDGALAEALQVRPRPLDEYLLGHPHRLDGEVVNLASRHPSGCELLCLAGDGRAASGLSLLIAELRQRYDTVLVDGALGERPVMDAVLELADALILVGSPAASSVQAAGSWIERVWAQGLQDRTALLVNRVVASPSPPLELELAFLHGAELPDEPRLADMDREALPWSVDRRLPVSRRLVEVAAQLFPALLPSRADHAA
jgi:Flp pilus assembly CpaE family ATPase